MDEQKHVHRNENADSLEFGTPGKGGVVKIYGDFFKPEEFERKIANAKIVRQAAQEQLG
jgi:hypothetical protein